jgi:hypothetical protein
MQKIYISCGAEGQTDLRFLKRAKESELVKSALFHSPILTSAPLTLCISLVVTISTLNGCKGNGDRKVVAFSLTRRRLSSCT